MRTRAKNPSIVDIPSSVLKDRSISVLEAIVRYLKDKHKMTYHEIAVLLNRDDRTIWTVYSRVKKKTGKMTRLKKKEQRNEIHNLSVIDIPSSVLKDRSLSVLEAIVRYLKDKHKMTYHEIAVLLNRDDRTIWTVYSRVKKKTGK